MPTRDSWDAWRTILGEFYEVSAPEVAGSRFSADLTTWNIGGVLFSQGTMGAQRFIRTARRARRDGFDSYSLVLYRSGSWRGNAGERDLALDPGGLQLIDFARPIAADVTTNDSITLGISRDFLDEVLPPRDLHGFRFHGGSGDLLRDFLLSLSERVPGLTTRDGPHVAAALRDLLAACVQPFPAAIERARPQMDAIAWRRARALIEANLHRRDWSSEELRAALGVSRSTLYRIFEFAGGVAEHIRSRRLARAHDMLARSNGASRVYAIAEACGFGSEAHFSRAFRRAYGYTAREAIGSRSAIPPIRPSAPAAERVDEAGFIGWIRTLRD